MTAAARETHRCWALRPSGVFAGLQEEGSSVPALGKLWPSRVKLDPWLMACHQRTALGKMWPFVGVKIDRWLFQDDHVPSRNPFVGTHLGSSQSRETGRPNHVRLLFRISSIGRAPPPPVKQDLRVRGQQ